MCKTRGNVGAHHDGHQRQTDARAPHPHIAVVSHQPPLRVPQGGQLVLTAHLLAAAAGVGGVDGVGGVGGVDDVDDDFLLHTTELARLAGQWL